MSSISDLRPAAIWHFFDSITKVPRPSGNVGRMVEFLQDFARSRSLECRTDAVGNVTICKPATAGMEDRPTVVLQSHMDMVCDSRVPFDFTREAIRTKVEDGWVSAQDTTLGADCGIGMAAQLAVLDDGEMAHPAVEALFTVDEETGLTGAFNLGEGMISGKYLLNLDSEDEGIIFIGCAGGKDTVARFPLETEPAPKGTESVMITVSGLLGGHSGDDIEKGRGNANRIMARLILENPSLGLRIADFKGGNLRNAIPHEACVLACLPAGSYGSLSAAAEALQAQLRTELAYSDPDVSVSVCGADPVQSVLCEGLQSRLLMALEGVPNGVLGMSMAMPGLVETSSNLASVRFRDGAVVVASSQRSSVDALLDQASRSVAHVFSMAGAEVAHSDGYPGWAPNPESRLLGTVTGCYEGLFSRKPVVKAVHAGLECGLFLRMYPWLDMVSFGPTLRGVHTPDERLEISTVGMFWDLLVKVLSDVR